MLEKILLPKTDLDDEDGIDVCPLVDCRLSQSVSPKRPILGGVAVEVVVEAFVVVIVHGALSLASLSLSKALDCSKPALSDLTEMRTRG